MGGEKKKVVVIKHYRSDQKILLVGEGDFSFALSLANAFGKASKIFATSLDSQDEVMLKYRAGESNLEDLKDKNCTILHEVDAHALSSHAVLQRHRFDRIIFNFPHANVPLLGGHHMFRPENDYLQIELHKNLIKGFFKSAYKLLSKTGEIHVTHKTSHPFDRWNITELAEEEGLNLIDEAPFYKWEYPGYTNKKGEGHGSRCDRTFPVGACSTFMFSVR
ncbi:uncharacterized protein At4g26485-like [Silene latifolia]|uniref:uncharacterized protein At4g26485-like n=1 Tax=Silene latifolia TaxID=37657 RepID=UPI003D77C0A3